MAHNDNPAARLSRFMKQLRPYEHEPTGAALRCCEVLGLTWPDDMPTMLIRLAAVTNLARQVRSLTNDLPPDADVDAVVMMQHFGEAEAVVERFGSVGSLQMIQLMDGMKETGWHSLALAATLLRRYAREPALDDDLVQRLLDQVRSLIDEVANADDLETEVRMALIRRLRDVEDALVSVKVTGFVRVEGASDRLAGQVLRVQPVSWQSKTMKAVGRFARDLIIATAAASAATIPSLVAGDGQPTQQSTPNPPAVIVINMLIQNQMPALPPGPSEGYGPAAINPP